MSKHTTGAWLGMLGKMVSAAGNRDASAWEQGEQVAAAHTELFNEMRRMDEVQAALLDALERVTRGRHIHTSIGSPDGGETCGKCGESYRSSIHYAYGESHSDDLEKARAAIAKAKGEKA